MARTKKADQAKDAGKTIKDAATEPEAAGQAQEAIQEPETAGQAQETTPEPEAAGQVQETAPEPEAAEQAQSVSQKSERANAKTRAEDAAAIEAAASDVRPEMNENGEITMEPEPDMFANLPNPCVYCGPSIKGVARQYTTYQGGITDALREFIQKHPIALGLIVPAWKFQTMRRNLGIRGTPEAELYKAVKAETTGTPRKPSEAGFVGEGGARERA